MKTIEELKEKFKLTIDKGIITLVFLKEETDSFDSLKLAELVKSAVEEVLKRDPNQSYSSIVDLSPLKKKISYLSFEVREVYGKIMSSPQLRKIAILGSNLFYSVALGFIIKIGGKGENIKFFSTKAEALNWLKEI